MWQSSIKKRTRRIWRRKRFEIILVLLIVISSSYVFYNFQNPKKNTIAATPGAMNGQLDDLIIQDTANIKFIPLIHGAVVGFLGNVSPRDSANVQFTGWAFDALNSKLPEAILISYNGKNIYWGQTNHDRPGVAKIYGQAALHTGYNFVLPLKLFKDNELNQSKVRVFAVSNGVASELLYPEGFK